MSLKNSLYHIIDYSENSYTIGFNSSHPVFGGHFPGHPIVPGACLVQIAQELASAQPFTAIRNLKFRQPVTPDMQVRITINNDKFTIGSIDSTEIYAQFAATYMCPHSDL